MKRWKKRRGTVVIPSHGGIFPKEPESRLEALLVALNTEPKQVLTLACLDESWKTGQDLWHDWYNIQIDWLPRTNTLSGYCENSLLPHGFVRQHSVLFNDDDRHVKRYKLSDDGLYFASHAAAFMLQYSIKIQESLYGVLGSTPSNGPPNRIKILRYFSQGRKNLKKIGESLRVCTTTVKNHQSSLQALGFIEYGVGRPREIEITDKGRDLLDNFMTPLFTLSEGNPNYSIKAAHAELQDRDVFKAYAQQGIQQYRSIATRNYSTA